MNQEVMDRPRKIGSLRRSWMITKSAWRIMMLDKEILWVPLVAGLIGIVIAAAGYGAGYAIASNNNINAVVDPNGGIHPTHWSYAVWVLTSALLALLSTYTIAAMTAISLKRLRGGDPALGDGWSAVKRRLKPLTVFALFSFGIIQILQFLEQRLPFAGKILAFLGEIAWRVAGFFAVPIIVDSVEDLGPIDATKKSMKLIKQTWKESGANQFVIGTIFVVALVLELITGIGITAFSATTVGNALAVVTGVLTLLAVLLTILVSAAMDGIAKAVLYYYAVTGEAPALFDKRLLQEAFTAKKARKLFRSV